MIRRAVWAVALVAMGNAAIPARAQAQEADKVAEAMAAARARLSAVEPRQRCAPALDDEIVVCGRTDSSRYRVPSTTTSDPNSREALRTGVPSPPQLDRGSCKGQANCVGFGYVPPPVYYIDLKAIPEAPEGSEAAQVAKGEKAAR